MQTNVSASSTLRRSMNTWFSSTSLDTNRRFPSAAHRVGEEPSTTKWVAPKARPRDFASSGP